MNSATMSTPDVLRVARDLYAANPSHRGLGSPRPQDGSVCVVEALCKAEAGEKAFHLLRFAMFGAPRGGAMIEYNAENDTKTVVAAFDSAIALAEGSQ